MAKKEEERKSPTSEDPKENPSVTNTDKPSPQPGRDALMEAIRKKRTN